ncbi:MULTISPECIES: anti-sigma factor family protein [Burkholderia]|uniref:anti-sigma factor family protein n=1 Tax=Burkholderia TaxID=32008 RepID=UPI0008422A13|nr:MULTISPECIES: anti-sigma factor [unclassified Burkholderia]AOK28275.1 anti-sigma factor [Burkholderia sp. Bp7605]
MKLPPDEHDLHAYVDGWLDEAERAAVERYLARDPERAAQVHRWQQDAQRLRAALASLPPPPANPALDPAALRARRAERARARFALAASLVLCVGIGTLGGWHAHRLTGTPAAPMSDALEAYKLIVVERSARIDFPSRRPADLQAWLEARVGSAVKLPDLSGAGFRPVGGRLFATERGAAAMVLYEDAHGRTLSFYVRPPESAHRLLAAGQRIDGGLLARYGSSHGFNYAIVGRAGSLDETAVARALDAQI